MEKVIVNTAPDAARLATAINAGDLEAVKAWVAESGINTDVVYPVPGASFDATIKGTPFAIAVHQSQVDIALWLLQNGATHESYGFSSEAGYMQSHTYHPLGSAMVNGLDSVAKLMLEQGVDFHTLQRTWHEGWHDVEFETFGSVFLNHRDARPMLERIGRLDVLEFLEKQDLRTQEERDYDTAMQVA